MLHFTVAFDQVSTLKDLVSLEKIPANLINKLINEQKNNEKGKIKNNQKSIHVCQYCLWKFEYLPSAI